MASDDVLSYIKNADFIFCHAMLHHLNDAECAGLIERVGSYARKPATMIMLEPILDPWWLNPPGHILAKMDDGKYVRTSGQYKAILGTLDSVQGMSLLPRWPVRGEAYTKRFD